jgi:hypothetical protein
MDSASERERQDENKTLTAAQVKLASRRNVASISTFLCSSFFSFLAFSLSCVGGLSRGGMKTRVLSFVRSFVRSLR